MILDFRNERPTVAHPENKYGILGIHELDDIDTNEPCSVVREFLRVVKMKGLTSREQHS
jgi:hypothetical protein